MCWSTRYSAHGAPVAPQNQPPAGVRTLGWGVSRWGKMMFLVGEIVVSLDNLGAETACACPSTETKITCSHVFVDEILGTWRARSPPERPF